MSATGARCAGACTEPRVARCMRGRTGADCGAGSRRRSSIRTGAGRSASAGAAGASRAGDRLGAAHDRRRLHLGVGRVGTGSERAEPGGAAGDALARRGAASRERRRRGRRQGRLGRLAGDRRRRGARLRHAGRAPLDDPRSAAALQLRAGAGARGVGGLAAIACSDIAIAFSASPPKIHAASQSAMPTGGVATRRGAGGAAGASAAAARDLGCRGGLARRAGARRAQPRRRTQHARGHARGRPPRRRGARSRPGGPAWAPAARAGARGARVPRRWMCGRRVSISPRGPIRWCRRYQSPSATTPASASASARKLLRSRCSRSRIVSSGQWR